MMYPWDVLGIPETSDRKSIKKAYAKLIRQYRPDEHPDEFQEINQAYDFALKRKFNSQTQKSETNSKTSLKKTEYKNLSSLGSYELHDTGYEIERKIAENILALTKQMNSKGIDFRSEIKNWEFLNSFERILDLDLRGYVCKKMLEIVSNHNYQSVLNNKIMYLPSKIFKNLDATFDWSSEWREYRLSISQEKTNLLFNSLEKEKIAINPGYRPHFIRRAVSFCGDILFYFLILAVLIFIIPFVALSLDLIIDLNLNNETQLMLMIFGFFVYRLIFSLLSLGNQTPLAQKLGANYSTEGYRVSG